jgi:ABC-type glycerol-3-phosphate transport system substrate-binding protein
MSKLKILVIAVLLTGMLVVGVGSLRAQNQQVILQLAVPGFLRDSLTQNNILSQFETAHPGVTVQIVSTGDGGAFFTVGGNAGQGDITTVLNNSQTYATSADVLAISSSDLTPEQTRAGFYLDLSPLVSSDSSLNSADYYPAVWQSFQWDGGIWALPISADPVLLFYDKSAFDAANLPYPDTWQSINDVESAIRALTKLNADGTVASPGFVNLGGDVNLLAISLLGQGVYDSSAVPSVPDFSNSNLEPILTAWAQMQSDGLFNPPSSSDVNPLNAPLQLGRASLVGRARGFGPNSNATNAPSYTPALLPGGRAGLYVDGFAVSSGTQQPELAYQLAEFLTNTPQVANGFFGTTPARQSLANTATAAPAGSGGGPGNGGFRGGGAPSAAVTAILPTAFQKGISPSDARFADYLSQAVSDMVTNKVDAHTALQDVQTTALADLQAATTLAQTVHLTVSTPLPTPTVPAGKVAIKFGVESPASPLPNQDQWNTLAQNFAANDPQVGLVEVQQVDGGSLQNMAQQYDCFMTNNNEVPTADLSQLLSLDPLMESDPSFNQNDFVGNALSAVQRDGKTWAMPIELQPLALRYNVDQFTKAGLSQPSDNWTVNDFENALRALKPNSTDPAPFVSATPGDTYMLMLIAAYGGLPFDYRTNPVTVNFTDPATVNAIQQVLDLVKGGYINYSPLGGGGFFRLTAGSLPAIFSQNLSGFGFGGGGRIAAAISGNSSQSPQYLLTTFPQGTQYSAVSYTVSAAYISATTPNAEGCYRFISALSSQAGLMTAMPARQSVINSPDLATAQGNNAVAFYQAMEKLIQQPNTIVFPAQGGGAGAAGNNMVLAWLNRAFDRYINNGADLTTELTNAEVYTKGFQQCTAAIPAFVPGSGSFQQYFQQFSNCATQVDASIAQYIGGLG